MSGAYWPPHGTPNPDCALRGEPHGAHWIAGGKPGCDKLCGGLAPSSRPDVESPSVERGQS